MLTNLLLRLCDSFSMISQQSSYHRNLRDEKYHESSKTKCMSTDQRSSPSLNLEALQKGSASIQSEIGKCGPSPDGAKAIRPDQIEGFSFSLRTFKSISTVSELSVFSPVWGSTPTPHSHWIIQMEDMDDRPGEDMDFQLSLKDHGSSFMILQNMEMELFLLGLIGVGEHMKVTVHTKGLTDYLELPISEAYVLIRAMLDDVQPLGYRVKRTKATNNHVSLQNIPAEIEREKMEKAQESESSESYLGGYDSDDCEWIRTVKPRSRLKRFKRFIRTLWFRFTLGQEKASKRHPKNHYVVLRDKYYRMSPYKHPSSKGSL